MPSPSTECDVDGQHHALADERGDGFVGGFAIELRRRGDLPQPSVVHHGNPIGERHRFGLIVRDVDHRRAGAGVEAGELVFHRRAEIDVEVGERLVEQHERRLGDEAARERDALALAAGEQRRAAGRRSRRARPASAPPRRGARVRDP